MKKRVVPITVKETNARNLVVWATEAPPDVVYIFRRPATAAFWKVKNGKARKLTRQDGGKETALRKINNIIEKHVDVYIITELSKGGKPVKAIHCGKFRRKLLTLSEIEI